jgi:hypothetical protein
MVAEFVEDEPGLGVSVGTASITLATGTYVGTLLDGRGLLRHGKGTMRYLDGSVHTGEWDQGDIHGKGTMRYSDGSHYTGQWQRGLYHGPGTLTMMAAHRCVEVVAGQWCEGKMHGPAVRSHWNGAWYQGTYHFNQRHGTGSYQSTNGDTYDGQVCSERWRVRIWRCLVLGGARRRVRDRLMPVCLLLLSLLVAVQLAHDRAHTPRPWYPCHLCTHTLLVCSGCLTFERARALQCTTVAGVDTRATG